MSRRFAAAMAVLLLVPVVLSGLGGAAGAVATPLAAPQTYDLGDDHALATNESVETYQETGVVSTGVNGLDARLTIAQSHDVVGLETISTDFNSHYVRIQYNESIPRELRFELPAGYFEPYPADGLSAENVNVTADLEPIDDGNATGVTVTLEGQTDAVFRLSKAASVVFGARDTTSGAIERFTGWELPSLTSSDDDWTHVPATAWNGTNSTPAIETTDEPLMIQYDASDTPGEQRWISVPRCGNAQDWEDVCRFSRDGTDAALLVSRTNETPEVRYRHGRSLLDQGQATVNELIESIEEFIDGILGGVV